VNACLQALVKSEAAHRLNIGTALVDAPRTTSVPNESTSPRCNPSAQKSPSTVPKALATNIASQNAGEGLSARALKPKAFAEPAVHVRSEFMIESRRLFGDELNRTRLLGSQEERDASE